MSFELHSVELKQVIEALPSKLKPSLHINVSVVSIAYAYDISPIEILPLAGMLGTGQVISKINCFRFLFVFAF